MSSHELDPRLDALAPLAPLVELLADRIVDKWLERTDSRMIPQGVSPLGPRKHRDAVKRRVRNNEGGAAITERGRKFLLTREALAEELRGRGKPEPPPEPPPSPPTPSPSTQSPDAAAYARDLITRMQGLRVPKKA